MTRSPEALTPATEAIDLIETLPVVVTVTDEPSRLSVHVTLVVGFPEKNTLIVIPLPSASIKPVAVDVGHLTVMPPAWSWVLVDEAETAAPAGVMAAFAGVAATASAQSMAVARSSPRTDTVFMECVSLSPNQVTGT
jgi:hypothetical protein